MILSLLGFASACSDEENESQREEPSAEYGTPYVTFSVKGRIVDAGHQSGIRSLAVNIAIPNPYDPYYPTSVSTLTNWEGEFDLQLTNSLHGTEEGRIEGVLRITDTDRELNNLYPYTEVPITLETDPDVDTSGWCVGGYKLEGLVIEMERISEATPARYNISGQIVNKENAPIAGILVSYDEAHTTKSKADGTFCLSGIVIEGESRPTLTIRFEDIDQEQNGGWFMSEAVEVAFAPNPSDDRYFTAEEVLVMLEEQSMAEYGTPYIPFSRKEAAADKQ